jgi:hypothetical protein
VVGLQDALRDGQAEAGTADGAVAGTLAAVQGREQVRQVSGGDAGAVVGDGERRLGVGAGSARFDVSVMLVNEKKVARVTWKFSIAGIRPRRKVRTTVPEPSNTPVGDGRRRHQCGQRRLRVLPRRPY